MERKDEERIFGAMSAGDLFTLEYFRELTRALVRAGALTEAQASVMRENVIARLRHHADVFEKKRETHAAARAHMLRGYADALDEKPAVRRDTRWPLPPKP